MEDLKRLLSAKFWEGKRWVAVPLGVGCEWRRALRFFHSYESAQLFCEDAGCEYKICVLADALRRLNTSAAVRFAPRLVRDVIRRYPFLKFDSLDAIVAALARGNYYPVTWTNARNPLREMKKYCVIEQGLTNRIVFSSDCFCEGIVRWQAEVSRICASSGCNFSLLFIGLWRGDLAVLPRKGMPDNSGALLLYSAVCESGDGRFIVEQHHDVAEPFFVNEILFAKLNIKRDRLDFYNGSLKRVLPGIGGGWMDVAFFNVEAFENNLMV